MTGRLAAKSVLITGAARGQGAAEARLFVAEGARVVIADVLESEGRALAGELGDSARFVPLDVTREDQWARAVEMTVEEFGSLDVLVNNAGVLRFNRLQSETLDGFRSVLDVNLVGVFLGMQAAAGPMAERGGGSIVNISSTAGLVGMPGTAAYVASKWGVTGLTKAAAIDLGPSGIRVNSVHPGSIDTPMIRMDGLPTEAFEPYYRRLPIKRLGTADEVAKAVLFLASDESSYCTGASFVVDGGQTCGDHGLLGV
ncbi:MAG: glucose 1-dehydrogenase [Acidimicrobiales bacterium]|nr:glucose 1-dehydrogenase [Acidimicrobiales bacterium]